MKFIRYSRYTGEDMGIGAEDLLQALSDFLLESGFNTQYMPLSEWNQHTLEDLKKAIQQALEQGKLFDDESLQEMMDRLESMSQEQMDKLLDNLVQKMVDEGQIAIDEPSEQQAPAPGLGNGKDSKVKFEVTDKSLDFLGFKTLKDLLGSLGKSSFGRHDTRDLATGIETSGSSKDYEFGDMLNLDVSETLFSAIRREGAKVPLDMDYSDLKVHQCEYQSSCATVLMLDCSHSMILYGEDRFTPAKKVALALAHLIRTQYPGDSLRCVLFHDTAEELALSQLARVQVGPYYTHTRDGLILAQRLLNQER
jgi:Ca-activated chloride channel homolog